MDVALAAGTPLVRLHAVTKTFPGIVANAAIHLALWPGEVHVLLGDNGAGKSTLVTLLSGVLQPDGGYIEVAGAAQRIGTVFQHPMLVPTLTLAENLALADPWWRRSALLARRDTPPDTHRRLCPPVYSRVRYPPPRGANPCRHFVRRECPENPAGARTHHRARAVIFAKPTYGLDLHDSLAIRERIRQAAAQGGAVMRRGQIAGMVVNDAHARRRTGALISGETL